MREEKGNENGGKTIRVSEQTYNKLGKIGTVSQSYDDVIKTLLSFYDIYGSKDRTNNPTVFKDHFRLPIRIDDERLALDMFDYVLSLGNDVSYILRDDEYAGKPTAGRKNGVIFFKQCTPFLKFASTEDVVYTYVRVDPDSLYLDGWLHQDSLNSASDKSLIERTRGRIRAAYRDAL